MNINFLKQNRFLRFTGIVTVIMFGILSVLGSGGGDDDGGNGDTGIGLLPSYNYNINSTAAYDDNNQQSDGLTVTIVDTPSNIVLRIDPHPVVGTFSCNTNTGDCGLAGINTGTFLDVYDENTTLFVGNLHIQVLDQVTYGVSGLPVIGRIQIESVAAPDGLGEGFIQIEMTTCMTGAGVNIYDNGELVGCFTWDQFEQLLDTSGDAVEQLASFGYQIFNFLFEQVHFVTEVFGIIDDFAVDLEQNGTISEMCDAFSAYGLSPPPGGWLDQGIRTLSWSDVNIDGNVGPGDSFFAQLEDCWFYPDPILNGSPWFYGYVESVDQNRGVITAIGFTSVTPPNPGGFIGSIGIVETEESITIPGTTEITSEIGVNGGFSILFTEP